jgi:hypothetical protein
MSARVCFALLKAVELNCTTPSSPLSSLTQWADVFLRLEMRTPDFGPVSGIFRWFGVAGKAVKHEK